MNAKLSPWPVRLLVLVVWFIIAVFAVVAIDRRAMMRQREMRAPQERLTSPSRP